MIDDSNTGFSVALKHGSTCPMNSLVRDLDVKRNYSQCHWKRLKKKKKKEKTRNNSDWNMTTIKLKSKYE